MRMKLALSWLGWPALAVACTASTLPEGSPTSGASDAAASTTSGGGTSAGSQQHDPGGAAGSGGSSSLPTDSGSGGRAGSPGDGGSFIETPDAAPDAVIQARTFTCTQVIGVVLTSEWYLAGFENGVDNARWQLKWAEHSYVDEWAKADSPFWAAPVVSPCAESGAAPDRIVFVSLSWTLMAEKDWEIALTGAVDNIKSKYPSARSIELLTIIRGPANKACDPNPNAAESTRIPAGLDEAIAQVALHNPGLVAAGPKVEATACSDFNGVGPHLTSAGNMKMAQLYSAYYAKAP